MARPRVPLAKAEVTGASIINAGRFKDRKAPKTKPLGSPYRGMTPGQIEAWEAFRDELPWLNGAHRALLQVACVLRARLNAEPEMGVNAIATYSAVLSKLAATPVDETKVSSPDADDEDPADRYFGRPN